MVSGYDQESLKEITAVYKLVVDAEIYEAPSIKVAEAAKIIENTQRDVNIALMNELSIILAGWASTLMMCLKLLAPMEFLKFYPGWLVGTALGLTLLPGT